MGTMTDFEQYRELHDRRPSEEHSLEALGLTHEDAFRAAVEDPQSVVESVQGVVMPILTPLHHLSDRNSELYDRLASKTNGGPVGPVYFYDYVLSSMTDNEDIASTLQTLAASRGVIAYDCAQQCIEQSDATVQALLRRIGGIACQQVLDMPSHHHYLMQLAVPGVRYGSAQSLSNLPRLYRQGVESGAIVANEAISVEGCLSEADCAHIAGYYWKRHDALTQSDATEAGFSPEALRDVLTSQQFIKVVYRVDNKVANFALLADPRDCSWIDQQFIRDRYPDHYDNGRVLIGIGVVSDPEAAVGLGKVTIGVVGRLLAYAGGDIILGIATDDESNKYIPSMSADGLRRAGLNPQPVEAVSGVAFRAIVLRPE